MSRFLITGAAGTIGSALVKELLYQGNTVCAFDNREEGLFELSKSIDQERAVNLRLFLGCIRDQSRLNQALQGVDFVIHCAAFKHVEICEYNAFECVRTNVDGVDNVIQSSIYNAVKKVIFTSSDKAVNPTSVMGTTKLLGEKLMIAANTYIGSHQTRFSCVRFGNVLDSSGSLCQILKAQLREGRAMTITSSEMTRFFLTISDAVQLTLKSLKCMIGGEIFVLNMGACNIMALARSMSGDKSPECIFIGPKKGEKIYEELSTDIEASRTVISDNLITILPESIDEMPDDLKANYTKLIALPRFNQQLRSDNVSHLSDQQVSELLKRALII